ncbi:S8 family peptidase [Peribacillus asahii]|uniref:S8 family peptidase n=1 Tax=Peribacillus asahii TaxID=228899 RepID=UPI00207AC923|nr:S8 family peptidase [Peribacillus asahii]USK60451.1 S8 family peptidase [Peribacillus asahii]
MFDYSVIQFIQTYAHQLDKPLQAEILNLYKRFKRAPKFLQHRLGPLFLHTLKLSVIVEFEDMECQKQSVQHLQHSLTTNAHCQFKNQFSCVPCCSAEITLAALADLFKSHSTIRKVHLNRQVQALLDHAIPSVQADHVVRNNNQLTGQGITIAVIDTGVYPHSDLEGRIVDFVDFINRRSAPYDDNGHGTHCAGAAAGNGAASGGQYKGAAPKANIIGVKVLDRLGAGSLETVMQGVEWCIEYNRNHPNNPIHVISLSLGSPPQRFREENADPMVQVVEKAWQSGIVVCVAAGNSGPRDRTIASPGISNEVITVGALDDRNTQYTQQDDVAADFSSRGPTPYGETKPDLLAPGVNIISLRAPNSYLDRSQSSRRVQPNYFSLSGTSMATPICAGIVALMLEHYPHLAPNEVKERLKKGTVQWKDTNSNLYGAGYINAENSI